MNESQNQIVFPTLSQPVPGVQIVEREGQSGERVKFPGGGGPLGNSGWGGAAGTLEPLTYTRASSAEFCYPILE